MSDDAARPHNAFEPDQPGTVDRTTAEGRIERLRLEGGVFVEAVRATRMPMAVTDPGLPGNPIVFANDAFLQLSGYSMDEVLGQQPHFMNGAGTDPDDAVAFREALADDRDTVIETVQYRKDGSRFLASVFLSAFKDDAGRTLHQFLSYLDVTARETAEARLVESLLREEAANVSVAQLRHLIGTQAIWEADAAGLVVADSPSWRAYTGQKLEEWLGRSWADAVHPDDRAFAERQWREAVATRRLVDAEFRLRTADGGWRWTNIRAVPVLDAEGTISKWVGMNTDVDSRKRAEQALRASEERYRLILESARDYAIFTTDRENRIDTWPPGAEAVFGWSAEEVVGQPADITFTPDDVAAGVPAQEFETARRTGSAPNVRWHIRKDGKRVFIDGSSRARHAPDGTFLGILKIGQDVTRKHRAEEALRASEQRLQLAKTVGGLATWDWDLTNGSLAWSPQHFLMLGYEVDEVRPSYESWAARVHPEDLPGAEAAMHEARDRHAEYVREYRALWPDGTIRWCSAVGRFFYDDEGRPVRMVGVQQDVSESKAAAERQRVLLAELQHRVRNILGVIRSLARRGSTEGVSAADYLAHLDGRLNALSRVQTVLTRAPHRGVDLRSLVQDQMVAHAAEGDQASVEGPDVALHGRTAEGFALALHELATNAVKHGALSRAGASVAVRWSVEDGNRRLRFEWRERGVPSEPGPMPRRNPGAAWS